MRMGSIAQPAFEAANLGVPEAFMGGAWKLCLSPPLSGTDSSHWGYSSYSRLGSSRTGAGRGLKTPRDYGEALDGAWRTFRAWFGCIDGSGSGKDQLGTPFGRHGDSCAITDKSSGRSAFVPIHENGSSPSRQP